MKDLLIILVTLLLSLAVKAVCALIITAILVALGWTFGTTHMMFWVIFGIIIVIGLLF